MSLGTNVNYLRRQKKMTQERLAEQLCVTRQTVSRWETDEVTPELAKLVEMCSLFACSLDALVREDLAAGSKIYSDVTIRSLPSFRLAGYVMISPCPENDVNGYMDRWAGESGLKAAFPAAKRIGWDFPFVTPEQQNRFGLRGYAAAYVLPDGFETNHPGVRYFENAAAEYAAVTVRDPFAQSFERIPNAYQKIMEYLRDNKRKAKQQADVLSCFEYVYQCGETTYMDVYVHVGGPAPCAQQAPGGRSQD